MYKIRRPEFRQELQRRDIQIDGYYGYNKRTFIETFFSPYNAPKAQDTKDYIFNKDKYDYYVDQNIDFIHKTFDEKGNQDNSINQKYDFADLMNIGIKSFQNRPKKYKNFFSKVFSSFAYDSVKGYLGNSEIFYHAINAIVDNPK